MATGMHILKAMVDGICHLISPRVCHICGQTLLSSESVMCLGCELGLPRSNVHHEDFNEIHRRLGHHYVVERAAGWFFYKKNSPYAQLLIDAKYNNMPGIDYHLGQKCAYELQADGFFNGIDMLVPMPIYWTKRLIRGYNQAYEIARGIETVTGIPTVEAISAVKSHGIQSRHNKLQRYSSIANTMAIRDISTVTGKNILLIDDIITTGASCSEALRALSQAKPLTLNVLTLGLTSQNQ